MTCAIQHLYVFTKRELQAFADSLSHHLLFLSAHKPMQHSPAPQLSCEDSHHTVNSKDKRLSRQTAANKHHCHSGSHSGVSENQWHQSSSPFPSLCQGFHFTAFLIMSMNKTPAFPDTSHTAFHLLLYWHVFKVPAHYKKTTSSACSYNWELDH